MPAQTVYLKNYSAPTHSIESVMLTFHLHEDYALVTNTMEIKRFGENTNLLLHGDELELLSLKVDGKEHDEYVITDGKLDMVVDKASFALEIKTRIMPQNNTQLSGLYRSHTMFCTQCEAEGFRRITYFMDRPDVMTTYTTKIVANKSKYPTLLSNGNLIESGDLDDDRHFATWHDPFKKPSYLFALVAGNLVNIQDDYTTMSGRNVDLHIYVEYGNEDKCAHAMISLKKSMAWDERVYGREYDLDIFMIVAVSDFNMGAMENKGLNIFNSKYILASPDSATDQDYAGIEGVVAHEYFHNWTGNRVTCRDWFQLSLKEGLTVFRDQEFSRDMNSRDVNRIQDVRILRNHQFPEDASPMAHPVRPDSYIEINNFYTSTVYNKGAEVIRMQHTLLGKDGFRKGMDLYFERYDGQAVTIDDFVAAMEDANGVDFSQLKYWYCQAGTPQVDVKIEYSDQILSIDLSQTCPKTPERDDKNPFLIPITIAVFDWDGNKLDIGTELLKLTKHRQTFEFKGLLNEPVVSLIRGFSAPIKLNINYTDEQLQLLMKHETDGFARWEAGQRFAMSRLLELIKDYQTGTLLNLPDNLSLIYSHILDDTSMDDSLKAEVLMLPGFEDIANSVDIVDVEAIDAAREFYANFIGERLYKQLQEMFKSLNVDNDTSMDAKSYARRKLKNVCMYYMMKGNSENTIPLVKQHYDSACNMTDEIAYLGMLVHHDSSHTTNALEVFYSKWQHDELVLDKWFSVQAMSRLPAALDNVNSLMNNEKFSLKNPNKVRALIGTFCANALNFHCDEGYRFLTDIIIALDTLNPQIAARLFTPLTRWRRYDISRQDAMKKQLERLMTQKLSVDLYEMVSKSI
jgi:aminopeptidase N